MATPKLEKQKVIEAMKYIDQHGVPDKNKSRIYELVTEEGKTYPPKYVVAVAEHLTNGREISTNDFNAISANAALAKLGYTISSNHEEYTLTITAKSVWSTDSRFTMNDLTLGDNYKPLESYFQKANGDVVRRNYNKGERRITNQTLPRIACQVFEKQLVDLPMQERERFPVCQYKKEDSVIQGIFTSVEDFRKYKNSIEQLVYTSDKGIRLVIYSWSIFSTIVFCQECLKRFGEDGDQLILRYREKEEIAPPIPKEVLNTKGYRNPYSKMLLKSKNIIFRGAPGTGKSYLAKEIATDIISEGYEEDYAALDEEQKAQIEFVQFHPSYDYSDFVEGLRPRMNQDGTMGFELQDGVFKKFVTLARNQEDGSKKYIFIIDEINRGEISKILGELFFAIDPGYRGRTGEVSTQYANMHPLGEEKFYIPDNVYIIGTMNDIDRSVDSFDFAMRRRFRFVEIKAEDRLDMLESLEDNELQEEAISRMSALNKAIVAVEDLNENYQIGASYFLKLKSLSFDELWTDCLEPLLWDYVQGMYDEKGIMQTFAKAYGYKTRNEGGVDEAVQG